MFNWKQKKPILFKVTEPSSIPYRTPPACAKRAAYPDPPPVVPVPDTGVAQAAYKRLYCPGPLRPEMFSGIGHGFVMMIQSFTVQKLLLLIAAGPIAKLFAWG